jgi:hypothetical protein
MNVDKKVLAAVKKSFSKFDFVSGYQAIILKIFLFSFLIIGNPFDSFSQKDVNQEKLGFEDLNDLADHGFYQLPEYGTTKLEERRYSIIRFVDDYDEGEQLTFQYRRYYFGDIVQLYSSKLLEPSGRGDGLTHSWTIKYTTDESTYSKIFSEIINKGFVKINSKKINDYLYIDLLESKSYDYYILLINKDNSKLISRDESKSIYLGWKRTILDIFENKKVFDDERIVPR